MREADYRILSDVLEAGEEYLMTLATAMRGHVFVSPDQRRSVRDKLLVAVDELISNSELKK